jgi:hypothetical protein
MNSTHNEYIDKRIRDLQKTNKWNTKIVDTTHEDFIRDFGSCLFTNLVKDTFTRTYVKQFTCSDCSEPPTERCHGIGEERPVLIQRALNKVWSDTTKPIILREIVIAFLEEHKNTGFTFKCHSCHANERK